MDLRAPTGTINMASKRTMKAAAVQAEPVWFDLEATVDKTCKIIQDVAKNGADVVAFPECFVPGYPAWIWARPMDFEMNIKYAKNSLTVDSEQMKQLQTCAAENNIVVCLGYSELRGNTTYMAQCTIDSDGKLLMTRRKLKPFHLERTIFGDGDATSLNNVVPTSTGRVGQLSCGEHFNPLFAYSTYSQNEQIHVAAWPVVAPHPGGPAPYSMSDAAVASISQVYSMQAQCFTLHSTTVLSEASIAEIGTHQSPVFNAPGGGNARIFGPDGRQMTEDLPPTREGIVYAELDLDLIVKEKAILDNVGHFSRPELVWLGRNIGEQKVVRSS